MIDVRFASSLQAMLSLALGHEAGIDRLSSARLADGLGANATLVRKLLAPLIAAGLVESSHGRDGGLRLARPAASIMLGAIYTSATGGKSLWTPREVPHQCLVSANIADFVTRLSAEADAAVLRSLDRRSLADCLAEMRQRLPTRAP